MKRSPHISAAAEFSDAVHPERRTQLRHQPQSLVYVELDEGNGGIALNIGEDGMAVQAVMGLMDDFLARVRFQLSESKEWIETSAQVTWSNETRKLLGLRFVELPEESRQLIRQWVERESSRSEDAGSPDAPTDAYARVRAQARQMRAASPDAPAATSAVDVPAEAPAEAAPVDTPLEVAAAEGISIGPPVEPLSEAPAEAPSTIAADSLPDSHPSETPALSSESVPHITTVAAIAESTQVDSSVNAPVDSPVDPPVSAAVDPIGAPVGAPIDAPVETIGGLNAEREAKPVLSFQSDSFRSAATIDGGLPDKWTAAVFFLFLATASLAAGWAVGRGALAGSLQTFRKAVLREGAAGGAVIPRSSALAPQAHLSEIEIVNVNNDRWTIPLTSSAPVTGGQTRASSGGISPASNRGANVPYRTWVLTAPVQPRSSGNNSDPAAPPAVASAAEAAQNTIPLVEQPYSIPAPPPPKQAVVRAPQLVRRVDPVYPPLAVSRHLDGIVKMHIVVSASGTVRDVRVLSGPPMLAEAATRAASQWVYSPAIVDGKASDSEVDISIAFHLP
jgi:TonB family protein